MMRFVELQRVNGETGARTQDRYYVNSAHVVFWEAFWSAGREFSAVYLSNGGRLYVAEDVRQIWRMVDPS